MMAMIASDQNRPPDPLSRAPSRNGSVPVTRFAPSPNGPLHLGHAYAAMIAHDTARAGNGQFVLRIEDMDGARSRAHYAQDAVASLDWLGLVPDRPVVQQSTRLDLHRAALQRLQAAGLVYPCRCTRAQIAAAALTKGPDGPVYAGICRGRSASHGGTAPVAWRLDMARALALAGPLAWHDLRKGTLQATPEIFGDVVLWRKDTPGSYHLAVTCDDAADRITVVTRGMDLFAATHVHRLLQALLDLPVPRWLHHDLLVERDGRKLAKRRGSPSLKDLREQDVDGHAIIEQLRALCLPPELELSGEWHH
ncbi:tRNA glutamyl-Q(34) synthetase GluQRS [Croceicoccus sp. F390]|uniref:tRNA glutamyl-Q(34) synthetase GluQRS n=1 Tax=Croceicoccus esteveae TaxID=3075597 RepID=A0ABU2ZK94_9SPHN|nr:tRNA glutamyl-Q(34) synthetase GluQRS [Croceicoccus sp. F390]MDT0576796.1 tRNA glutamyl-Q(34) synthetase GluQRS [Croceicoccus sp. F390]